MNDENEINRLKTFQFFCKNHDEKLYNDLFPEDHEGKVLNNPYIFEVEALFRFLVDEGMSDMMGMKPVIESCSKTYFGVIKSDNYRIVWSEGEPQIRAAKEGDGISTEEIAKMFERNMNEEE